MPPDTEVRPRRQTEGAASGTGAGDDRLDVIVSHLVDDEGAPPVARVLRVTPTGTTRLVVVQCPYCGREHTHGWPYGQAEVGARVGHCRGGRGYFIRGAE